MDTRIHIPQARLRRRRSTGSDGNTRDRCGSAPVVHRACDRHTSSAVAEAQTTAAGAGIRGRQYACRGRRIVSIKQDLFVSAATKRKAERLPIVHNMTVYDTYSKLVAWFDAQPQDLQAAILAEGGGGQFRDC